MYISYNIAILLSDTVIDADPLVHGFICIINHKIIKS